MAAGARLFDLDGTLWDSYGLYTAITADTRLITVEAARAALDDGENVVALMRRLGLPRTAFSTSLVRMRTAVVPLPGMKAALEELRRRGHPLAVVTNLAGWIAQPTLHHLGLEGLFPVVIHAGSRAGRKPSPQPILAALDQLGIAEVSTAHVYIGDQRVDQLAAERAGLAFAWVSWGYGKAPTGMTVLRSPADILEL